MHEHQLLQTIYAASSNTKGISIGPGDDMGEVQIGNEKVLFAVDQLIVGRHVTDDTEPSLIGRKAVARCFSDIAAMCATPVGCLMTACVSKDASNDWCNEIFTGAKNAAKEWGGPLFGGDIATSDGAAIFTISAIASPPKNGAVLRQGAMSDDYLCVTGELGNSISKHHLSFSPRITEAKELHAILGSDLHSMIDISDGLGRDASHLANNGVQIIVDTSLLPLRDGADVQSAICDGEDYELLFTSATVPPSHLATVIGRVHTGNNTVVTKSGEDISNFGWNHE